MKLKNNKLSIENVSILNLAKRYGTPLYFYSYKQLKENINTFKKNRTYIDKECAKSV